MLRLLIFLPGLRFYLNKGAWTAFFYLLVLSCHGLSCFLEIVGAFFVVCEVRKRCLSSRLTMVRLCDRLHRDLLYEDPVDCGVHTISKERKALDETRTVSEVHRIPMKLATYGLFAGHGGTAAAELCARNFVPNILEDVALRDDPERALRNACETLEAFVLAKSALDKAHYGTTVLFVLVLDHQMYVVNIGNSRAVVATKDGTQTLTQEHDSSNVDEVRRVRNAGGFFQDGKVNNLIRVTRSIGDLELKERKNTAFPNHHLMDGAVIATPDIYCRKITIRDHFLVLATAEVWEHLPNKMVVQIVFDSLKKGENSRGCAKKVASAAIAGGARGPLTVMLLLFSNSAKALQDKISTPPTRKRTSRSSTRKRHSSNAEKELRDAKIKASVPPFVREAQAQEENTRVTQQAIPHSSPVTSPTVLKSKSVKWKGSDTMSSGMKTILPAPFLSLDVPPAVYGSLLVGMPHSERPGTVRGAPLPFNSHSKMTRAQSVLGLDRLAAVNQVKYYEERSSRQQFDVNRRAVQSRGNKEKSASFNCELEKPSSANVVGVSRVSELTTSGVTGGADSSQASFADPTNCDGGFEGLLDYSPSGPAKVRYREDGSVVSSKLAFLKEFGKPFTKRK